ncbi:MAG: tandem-95 repeat protein [Aliishimia sp.]
MTTTIDFNTLNGTPIQRGTVIDTEFRAEGVTISASGGSNQAMIFDTNNPTGGDYDLATNNLDNVLIISEDGDSNDPDDNARGGVLDFVFDEATSVKSLTFLDIEERAAVCFYDENNVLISVVHVSATGNNGQVVQNFDVEGAFRMVVTLNGSGAVDNLVFDSSGPAPDGVITGDDTSDVIDTTYVDEDGEKIDNSDALLAGEAAQDDIVLAGNGDDVVRAGEGNDEIFGEGGNDVLYGENGDDLIDGGNGNDMLFGGAGDDTVFGGAGNDKVEASRGDDIVSGGAGDDDLWGGRDEDVVSGGKGDDVVDGGDGDDLLFGGAGSDEIIGGDGNDTIYGGFKDVSQTLNFNELSTGEVVNGQYVADGVAISSADPLTPVMVFDSANPTGGDFDLSTNNLGNVLILSEDRDSDDPDDNAQGGKFVFEFEASATVHSLTLLDVEAGAWIKLYDDDGNLLRQVDVQTNNNGQFVADLGDTSCVCTMTVEFAGSGAIDNLGYTIDGSVGDEGDVIDGGDGDDIIFGQDGDDVLEGGAGADVLEGGDDRDTLIADSDDTVVDGGAGGDDFDTLDLTGQGSFYLAGPDGTGAPVEDSNGNGFDGTVVFVDADGVPTGETIGFTEIENFIGDEVNRGPDAVDDMAETDEDTPVTIDVLNNDTDPDGDPLEVISATSPDGTVEINPDGTVTFTPNEDFNGETTVDYTISDGNGGTDKAWVKVTVNAVNDAPDAVDDADGTLEDTAITVDLLANDTDVDGDDLTVISATVPADQGTLVDNGDGTVTFTPAQDFTGEATISYTIEDEEGLTDSAIHTVDVEAVNDAPVAVEDNATTPEDTPVTIDVLDNDSDPDGDPLTVIAASSPDGEVTINPDGTLEFTPNENFNGPTQIDYTITDPDGNEASTSVWVNVTAVNDAPDAVDDADGTLEDTAITVDLLANDTDVDGDDLTVISATVPAEQGTLVDNGDGTVTFTPAQDFTGEATISYTIEDEEGLTDSAIHTVDVEAVNDAPDAENDITETDEDTPVTIPVLDNDSDPDGDPLTVTEATSDDGDVTINPDGTITFTPNEDFNGHAIIDYTISDPDGNTDTAQVCVVVNAVNDAPDAVDDSDGTNEGVAVTVDLLANDTDVDGDNLTVIEATVPADQGTLIDNGNGTVTFTPAVGFVGVATISYTIEDEEGLTDSAIHTVDVANVNDAPDAVDDVVDGPILTGTPVTIDALENDTDPDGDDLTIISASVPPEQGTVEIVNNEVLFTPADGFEGEALIDYTIEDEDGLTDSAQITVPVANGIVNGTDAGELIDTDYEGDPGGDKVDNNDELLPGEGPNDDIIEAGGGNDTVLAGEGDDEVFAGTGDDIVDGGAGDDTIFGEEGDDVIKGGDGDDTVDGGIGDDTITTGDGSDTVFGGDGDDVIDTDNGSFLIDKGYPGVFPGEEGTPAQFDDIDFVDGGDGDDVIRTGDDADTIIGGAGNDTLDGGIDDDTIDGGTGDDRIVGGEGNDTIDGGDGDDTIFAGNDPDLGLDQFDIEDDGSNPLGPDLRPDNGQDVVRGGDGNDTIFGADDDDRLFGDAGDDFIDGQIDDDYIDGGIGDDTLLGGQGNDTIFGGDGDDVIDGGRNADELDGGDGNDTISGGNGADTIHGGAGDDVIDGGTGDDTLFGDDGDDFITGATGDDTIDGGAGNDLIDGGNGGSDTMFGGADRDTFINVDAGERVDGGSEGDDFDVLDLTGSAPNNGSLNVTFTNPDSNGNGFDGFVTYFDENGVETGTLEFTEIEDVIPCFTPGTLIATPRGELKVEELQVGDRVITRDNGIQEIRWIGHRGMTGAELEAAPHLKPVLIRKGALGNNLPERDMMVSPNHRVLVANDKTALYFEEREVLVAAKHLTGLEGVDIVDVSWTTYIHVMFDQHEVILSDGSWTESFQPGDMTLGSMGNAQRQEILELFPELATQIGIEAYTSARRSLKKHEAKLLTQ